MGSPVTPMEIVMSKIRKFFTKHSAELWRVIAWVSFFILFVCGTNLIIRKSHEPTGGEPLLMAASAMFFAWAVTRLKDELRPYLHVVAGILHFLTGAVFYIFVAVTLFALLALLGDSLSSFLTAPIGIKPDHTYTGWGTDWLLYAGITLAALIVFMIMKGFNERTKPQVAGPAAPPPIAPA